MDKRTIRALVADNYNISVAQKNNFQLYVQLITQATETDNLKVGSRPTIPALEASFPRKLIRHS